MPAVYISHPFCPQKCTFCNFASGVFPSSLESRYLEALRNEIASHEWRWRPDTVYLGGGTPSTMPPEALESILSLVPGRPWKEATIEVLPGTVTRERVLAWRKLGINRVSIGVQSFVDGEVRHTGRKHDAAMVAADCALLRGKGIENISLDLIAGLPGQTEASWNASLDQVERLDPPHVSVYLLEVDEDSRLGFEVMQKGTRYGAGEVPSDDLMAQLYEIAATRLSALGLARYEISNFAIPGRESVHNLKYWRLEPYAGFGADAHSFDGVCRVANVETAMEYTELASSGLSPIKERTAAEPAEKFFIGLRLAAGIEPDAAEWNAHAGAIERYAGAGLLEREGLRLRLTPRGVLLSNEVLQEFLP